MGESGLFNYQVVILLMMVGFYTVIARNNLIKTLIGLNVFQVSVFMLFISMGKVTGGTAPIVESSPPAAGYSNPLPHVLILTAIVVSVATTSLGLALVIRIREAYGTIEEDEILSRDELE